MSDKLLNKVKEHPLEDGIYRKHYMLVDTKSKQTIDHLQLIQIELPRAESKSNPLYPPRPDFTKAQWWLSLLRHSRLYTVDEVERLHTQGIMPVVIYQAFEMLDLKKWNPTLTAEYKEDITAKDVFEELLAVEREEGAKQEREETKKARKESKKARKEAKKARKEADKAIEDADKAIEDAEQGAKKAREEADKAIEDAEQGAKKARKEAKKARKEADKAREEADKAIEDAEQGAKKAREEADKAREEADKAREDAEQGAKKAREEMEKMREEVDKAREDVEQGAKKSRKKAEKVQRKWIIQMKSLALDDSLVCKVLGITVEEFSDLAKKDKT
eukprot:gene12096-25368_t